MFQLRCDENGAPRTGSSWFRTSAASGRVRRQRRRVVFVAPRLESRIPPWRAERTAAGVARKPLRRHSLVSPAIGQANAIPGVARQRRTVVSLAPMYKTLPAVRSSQKFHQDRDGSATATSAKVANRNRIERAAFTVSDHQECEQASCPTPRAGKPLRRLSPVEKCGRSSDGWSVRALPDLRDLASRTIAATR